MNRFKKRPMIRMAIPAILIIICCNCMQYSKDKYQGSKIKAIRLSFKIQLVSLDPFTLSSFEDSINIYYYKNAVLYQFPHPYETKKLKFDTNGNISHENMINKGVRYSYFTYKKDDLYGFKYDSITSLTSSRFLVDSFLNKKLSYKEETFDNSDDSLVESKKDHRNSILYEKYIPKVKADETFPDSMYYYYDNKLNDIDYSFSKKIDQEKDMKLCKIIFVYNPFQSNKYRREFPRREVRLEINEIPVSNSNGILSFFESHLTKDIQN